MTAQTHCDMCAADLNDMSRRVEEAVNELITIFRDKADIKKSKEDANKSLDDRDCNNLAGQFALTQIRSSQMFPLSDLTCYKSSS